MSSELRGDFEMKEFMDGFMPTYLDILGNIIFK